MRHDGVLMLVIDVNGNAAMTVGEYEPLADTSAKALPLRRGPLQGRRNRAAAEPLAA